MPGSRNAWGLRAHVPGVAPATRHERGGTASAARVRPCRRRRAAAPPGISFGDYANRAGALLADTSKGRLAMGSTNPSDAERPTAPNPPATRAEPRPRARTAMCIAPSCVRPQCHVSGGRDRGRSASARQCRARVSWPEGTMRGALGQCETLPIVVWDEMFVCRERPFIFLAEALLLV